MNVLGFERKYFKYLLLKKLMRKESLTSNLEYIKVTNNKICDKENINFLIKNSC